MARPQPTHKVPPEVVQAVWAAEDGRCEACKRPMDKRCARVTRVDDTNPDRTAANLHLVCVDCKARRPDLLVHLTLAEDVLQHIAGHLGPDQAAQATRWLLAALRKHGVLIKVWKDARIYWLPGIGYFRVTVPEDGPAVVTVDKLAGTGTLRPKPQARTRGLPPPDRRPRPARRPPAAVTTT